MEIRLQNDIRNLETKVEHFRAKSEELSSGRASDNNVNLLRQIEVLQAQHDIATQNWTGIEANLQTRISNLEQEAEDNSSRESYLRKKVKSLTESLKSVTNENESLNDQLDEVKSQLAKLKSSQTLLESELSDAKSTAAELESTIEKLKAEHDKKVSDLDEKLKMSTESLNQYKLQQQQQQRKKSNPVDPPFFGGEPVPRSGTISPFTQRLSVDDTNLFASAPNFSIKNGLSGRRTSSKASLPSLPGLTSDPSLNNGMQYPIDGLPTHFEVDDGDLMPPYSAVSETFRSSSIHTRDEGSTKFDKESVSTVGAGPSIQLVNRMSRSIRSLESELSNAKQDLARTELSRDEAVKDLSELMKELEELNNYKAQVTELESKINEMSLREQTALEMLGEKSEQVQELRADVVDIKTMFQQQIEELVDRLARAEKR